MTVMGAGVAVKDVPVIANNCLRAFWIAAVMAVVIVGISGSGTAWADQSIDCRTIIAIDSLLDNSPKFLIFSVIAFASVSLHPCEK